MTLRLYDAVATVTRVLDEHDGAVVEYAVDPGELAGLLATNLALHSGFLPPDVIWLSRRMQRGLLASYRPPQPTGIWLEGVDAALHVPMPGLILVQRLPASGGSLLFAVKETPHQTVQLFAAPLPNVGAHSGSICWGTVARAELDPAAPNDLTPVWRRLLGSAFVNHDLAGKSERHLDDIRLLLLELHETAAAEYPLDDLQPVKDARGRPLTLAGLMQQEEQP